VGKVGTKHTKEDLKIMQSWSLERKIRVTQTRIIEWHQHWEGKVYVSFSGGKDSTVLLDLARRIYPDIEAVFIDTGLEYPEIREFVRTKNNVTWIKPKMNFKEVIVKYGYPVISKEVSDAIWNARSKPDGCRAKRFNPNSEYCKKYGKRYDLSKWKFLLESNIPISDRCCHILKKDPIKKYEKETHNHPILATMTCESNLRKNSWLSTGCNAFDAKRPISQPISFWTEQDILHYIKRFNIPYSSIYGDIVEVNETDGQLKLIDNCWGKLKTTGADRTGCMFCMFGVHLEKEPNRFQKMKITHPKQYDYCMRSIDKGGLGLKEVLDFIGVKSD
jgi:3'-phosphoadenosine 5'-phosphosulfate sulfotransferase (PAPS reductase)/FAD synthetase